MGPGDMLGKIPKASRKFLLPKLRQMAAGIRTLSELEFRRIADDARQLVLTLNFSFNGETLYLQANQLVPQNEDGVPKMVMTEGKEEPVDKKMWRVEPVTDQAAQSELRKDNFLSNLKSQ